MIDSPEDFADVTSMMDKASKEWIWDTVVEESAMTVLFEEIGEKFVGQYLGDDTITPDNGGESFERFIFRGPDGKRYALNKSYRLTEGMKEVQPNQWCRITYVADIPTNRKQNPMKDFRIDIRKTQ